MILRKTIHACVSICLLTTIALNAADKQPLKKLRPSSAEQAKAQRKSQLKSISEVATQPTNSLTTIATLATLPNTVTTSTNAHSTQPHSTPPTATTTATLTAKMKLTDLKKTIETCSCGQCLGCLLQRMDKQVPVSVGPTVIGSTSAIAGALLSFQTAFPGFNPVVRIEISAPVTELPSKPAPTTKPAATAERCECGHAPIGQCRGCRAKGLNDLRVWQASLHRGNSSC